MASLDPSDVTSVAVRLVRRDRPATLRDALARAACRTWVVWSGTALGALAIYSVPPYTRFYGG